MLRSVAVADIIVGGRRSNPQRNVRGIAIAVAVLVVCVLVAYFIYERVVSYSRPDADFPSAPLVMQEDRATDDSTRLSFADSSLSFSGTLRVLRTSGAPQHLGTAQGRLFGHLVQQANKPFGINITETISRGGFFSSMVYDARLRWRYRFLDEGIPGHQLVEMAGVLHGSMKTAGSAPGYEDFVRYQAALDVGRAAPWSSNASFRAVTRATSFITTVRGTSGDRLLIGRSFALPGVSDGGDAAAGHVVLSFVKADGVIPFASIGWPGMVGVVSGINAEGIALMVHPVQTQDVRITDQAQPIPLLAREVLENAHDLEDAVKILKNEKNSPLGAAAFLIVDGNARQSALIERSPEQFAIQRNPKPAVVTDMLTLEPFTRDPENDRARRIQPADMRRKRIARLLRTRPSRPVDVLGVLRDNRDPAGAPLPLGHRGAVLDVGAVHAAVFDASGMVLWVADGDGAGARFRAFDLRYELRGEGARPAPPADLPADTEIDPSDARRIRGARQALREARRADVSGNRTRADELVQRALTYAPDLPEALELAGTLARARGDVEKARAYYERFLEAGPDDFGIEAEVRAFLGE